jgi:lysyl-tRNA synthetase class 2
MKPEKQEQIDGDEKYLEIGVPIQWADPLKAFGFTTFARLKDIEK